MSRFITGIYNYCDYWCARCPFTQRCRNYTEERSLTLLSQMDKDKQLEETDAVNSEFWDHLAENLRHAAVFGKHSAVAGDWEEDPDIFDYNIDDLESEEDYLEREQAIRTCVSEHLSSKLAKEYMLKVRDWLKDKQTDEDLKAVACGWMKQVGTPFDDTDYEEAALEMRDLLDVVTWYHTLISSKLYRALRGLFDPFDGDGPGVEIINKSRLSDANGSAKVVLISIERSMAAWLRLLELLPQQEDTILAFLVLLQRMQKGIHVTLPDAASFVRPGFDPGPNLFDACGFDEDNYI